MKKSAVEKLIEDKLSKKIGKIFRYKRDSMKAKIADKIRIYKTYKSYYSRKNNKEMRDISSRIKRQSERTKTKSYHIRQKIGLYTRKSLPKQLQEYDQQERFQAKIKEGYSTKEGIRYYLQMSFPSHRA